MDFIGEKTEGGVTRREFRLQVNGDTVPGCVWAPEGAKGSRPLILLGHCLLYTSPSPRDS